MAADVLIAFLITLVIAVAVSLVYFIPLDISLLLERRDAVTMFSGGATWCIFSLGVDYRNGEGSLVVLLVGKPIWRRPLGEIGRAGEPAGAWDFGKAPDLFRELLQLRPDVMRIVRALIRHTRVTNLACDLRFGLSGPAATGMLFGMYAALRPLVLLPGRVSLSATPVFDREQFEGSCRCDLRIDRPLAIPALAIRLFFNPRARSLVDQARRNRQEVSV